MSTTEPVTGDGHAAGDLDGDLPGRAHVLVCGLHGLGLRIVEQLHATGEPVVVIDDDPDRRGARTVRAWGVPLLVADAANADALVRAGVDTASAVVCVESGDLRNLQIALLVRDRRPDVRLVTALTNAAVGRAVGDDAGPGTVLDVAALATPSVVEACLQSPVHELDVGGRRFLTATTEADRPGTLRTLFGDLAPLAASAPGTVEARTVEPADDGEGAATTLVCPGRDHRVATGDRVTLLGTETELAAAGVDTSVPEPGRRPSTRRGAGWEPDAHRSGSGRLRRSGSALAQVARDSDRGLWWALAALVGLIVVSTAVLSLGYKDTESHAAMGVVDALYFTVESVATVGFGDFSFADQALWLRLWAVFLMLAGIVTTAIPIAFFTDMLISRRLSSTAGRRRAASARGHVVIVGLGAVGVSVVAELRARDRAVVVLERDPANRFLDRARALDVPVVFGDATDPAALRAARVPQARAVAVLTSDDMANIETGLAVRDLLGDAWDAVPVVLRLFDRELARTVARRFDFRHVHATAELAAPWFVGAALGLDVLGTFPVHGSAFLLGRLRVAAGGGLDGLAMGELSARTRVVGLRRAGGAGRGELEHPPRRDTRFGAGDEAYLVGPYEELLEVLAHRRGRTRGGSPADPSVDPRPDPPAVPTVPSRGRA